MSSYRLSRGGAKSRPFYHVIVTDSRNARDGRNIERVGYFNPIAAGKDVRLELDTAKVKSWVEKGAQMTEKVGALYKEAAKPAGTDSQSLEVSASASPAGSGGATSINSSRTAGASPFPVAGGQDPGLRRCSMRNSTNRM